MKDDRHDRRFYENDNKQNEPRVENDYKNIIEIEVPNPSTATPPGSFRNSSKIGRNRSILMLIC